MADRYAHASDRLTSAAALLLADPSPEGEMLLHLLIYNDLYGDELMAAIETSERYLNRGEEMSPEKTDENKYQCAVCKLFGDARRVARFDDVLICASCVVKMEHAQDKLENDDE